MGWTISITAWVVIWSCLLPGFYLAPQAFPKQVPCDKTRKVFTDSWGIISDGPTGSKYTQNSHCEWLIKDGFHAEFLVTDCPNNCTHHGKCINNTCFCENDWGGKDCSRALCPNNCSHAGICGVKRCECNNEYSGQSCSLHKTHPEGNRWHWLSHSEGGLRPRAAHTAIYVQETDSYIFGGYDLNYTLSDLEVYRFSTSQWEDEYGNVLEDAASAEYLDPTLIATELQRNSGAKEIYGLPPSSLFWKVFYSIKDNNTFGLLDWTADGGQHGSREFRNMPKDKENEKSRSTIRIDRNNDPRRKHPRNIRPRYSQMSTR